jgi:mannitol/fructose-specific phosphotransferase system IIA component (Ntr-type)
LREDALENGIPFGQQDQADMLFSLEENSHASNYSKLEKALFGFGMQEEMEEELQPNDGMGM